MNILRSTNYLLFGLLVATVASPVLGVPFECSGQTSCGQDNVSKARVNDNINFSPDFCGGPMEKRELKKYITELAAITRNSSKSHILNKKLFAKNITITKNGKVTTISREHIDRHRSLLPTVSDWMDIAHRLANGKLTSAGWRGCMLQHGKVGFVSDNHGNFGLSAFDFDRPWSK